MTAAHDPRTVLVGIPALNEEHHIEACIRSLLVGDPGLDRVKIVVADGGSSDRTRDIIDALAAEHPNVSWIDNPGKLQSAGVNEVVDKTATAEHLYLVRCDAHAVYPPNYIFDVAWQMADRGVESLATVMDAVGDTCFGRGAAWIVDTKLGSGGSGHRGGAESGFVPHGHHAGMRIDWYRKLGGYVPSFTPNEDAEYDRRLTEAGGRVWLAAEIRFDYTMRATPRKLWTQYWKYGMGRARTSMAHNMRPQLRQLIPVLNVLALAGSMLLGVVHPILWAWAALYGTILLNASLWAALRHRSPCGLWAGVAAGIMHNAFGLGFLRQLVKRQPLA